MIRRSKTMTKLAVIKESVTHVIPMIGWYRYHPERSNKVLVPNFFHGQLMTMKGYLRYAPRHQLVLSKDKCRLLDCITSRSAMEGFCLPIQLHQSSCTNRSCASSTTPIKVMLLFRIIKNDGDGSYLFRHLLKFH